MKKLLRSATAITLAALTMSSCMDWLNSDQFEKNHVQADDFFSFGTTGKVVLCLDYGQTGAGALVSLYDADPMIHLDSCAVLNDTLVPLYQQFTDSEGKVFTEIGIPAHVISDVWLYSDFMALPQCEHCVIENGVIFNFRHAEPDITKAAGTKVSGNLESFKIRDGFHVISKWRNKYGGNQEDGNGIFSTGNLSGYDITAIKAAVWNGNSSKPGYLDNTRYASKGSEWTNTTVNKYFYNGAGKLDSLESAQVYFTFVQENGWYEDVIGYYFYPSDKVPASPDEVKKYIILPNASVSGNAPYGTTGFVADWGYGNAPVGTNTRVQLLYEDSNGRMTPDFPAGTTIGYFVISNGWNVGGEGTLLIEEEGTKAIPGTKAAGTKAIEQDIYIRKDQSGTVDLGAYYTNVEWSMDNYSCCAFNPRNEYSGTRYADIITWGATGNSTLTAFRNVWDSWGRCTRTDLATFHIHIVNSESEIPSQGEKLPGSIDFSKPIFYSNSEWNGSGEYRCMSRNTPSYIIYGFEDDVDKTFEDVVFTVSSYPQQAILDPKNPDIMDMNGVSAQRLRVATREVSTYCFEDMWPYEGDYDMNDVVVEHRSAVYFDNENDVLEVTDTFTVCNERYSSGAGVEDAFAIRIPKNERGVKIELPAGAYDETETGSIILFENAQDCIGDAFVIRRLFNKGDMTLGRLTRGLDLDPFIIPLMPDDISGGLTCRDDHRREVHFPKKTGTSMIEPLYYINDIEAFYVFRDNRHPFAISIPLPAAQSTSDIAYAKYNGSMFVIPQEMGDIENQYSKSGHSFAEWVESGGSRSTDWYKYYSPRSGEKVRTEMKRQ